MQRVRQRDLAEALQLDRSTVAKALRGDPRIAPATRGTLLATKNRSYVNTTGGRGTLL